MLLGQCKIADDKERENHAIWQVKQFLLTASCRPRLVVGHTCTPHSFEEDQPRESESLISFSINEVPYMTRRRLDTPWGSNLPNKGSIRLVLRTVSYPARSMLSGLRVKENRRYPYMSVGGHPVVHRIPQPWMWLEGSTPLTWREA